MTNRGTNTASTTAAKPPGRIASSSARFSVQWIAIGGLCILVLVGTVYGWNQWGRSVLKRPVYRIATENIHIPPPPPWIKTDVRAEVVRDGALGELTIFDPDVTIRVYQAFELHPWIAKVNRVAKQPAARLEVDLEYRQPVAWVEVPTGVMPGGEGGVIPVDAAATVLPSHDFTAADVATYLRILVPGISACGLAGTPWGDSRVSGAARIAALLEEVWQSMNLFRIRVSATTDSRFASEPVYELETKDGSRILWGHEPGKEHSDEPTAIAKIRRLQQIVESPPARVPNSDFIGDLRHPSR